MKSGLDSFPCKGWPVAVRPVFTIWEIENYA